MNAKTFAAVTGLALAAGVGGSALYDTVRGPQSPATSWSESNGRLVADHPALVTSTDFSAAAEQAVHAVVHVKTSV